MAIYKNREVSVGQLTQSSTPTKLITITYPTGETENVALGTVRLTEDEKKTLQKTYNDTYFDNLDTVSDDDIKAVRLGVPPSYDSDVKKQAEAKALQERATAENQKMVDKQKAEADKNLDQKVNAPTQTTVKK